MTSLQHGADHQKQLDLEEWCGQIGRERALARGWEKGAKGCLINRLASSYLHNVRLSYTKGLKAPGKHGAVWRLIHSQKELDHVALEAFVWIMSNINGNKRYNSVVSAVGRRAEYSLFLQHPAWGKSWHLKGLKLVGNGELGMRDLIAKLTSQNFRMAQNYKPLDQIQRAALGALFLEMFECSTRLVEFYVEKHAKRHYKMVRHTELYWKFLDQYKDALGMFRVAKLPMLVEPRPWTAYDDGGYLTMRLPISPVDRMDWLKLTKYLHSCVLRGVNHLQQQALCLDHQQIELMKEVWQLDHEMGSLPARHRMEWPKSHAKDKAFFQELWRVKADRRKDGARSAFISGMVSYDRLKEAERLFLPWTMDSRGRLYANGAQINVQASDHFRSSLQFEQKGPIKGHTKQLAHSLHAAYGLKDGSPDVWLLDNREWIIRCGRDPMDNLGQLQAAKEPWRFLQLCRDLAGFDGDPSYQSGTIHWRDQCCSGWGHVACLTGDADLALRTNVIGYERMDLYQAIGDQCLADMAKLLLSDKGNEAACAEWWMDNWPKRKLWKAAAMPLIYGRSYQSMVEEIELYLRDEVKDYLTEKGLRITELARVLSSSVFRVAKQSLPNLRDLADWLSKGAKLQIEKGVKPCFFTPNGMQVQSYGSTSHKECIELMLAGRRVKVQGNTNAGGKMDLMKTRRRIVPDYIHSFDSAFLIRFVDHWSNYGHPIEVVHDCFGTTIDHVETLGRELQDQWARFYSFNHLQSHHAMVEGTTGKSMPAPPIVGTLDRNRIGTNPHLFS